MQSFINFPVIYLIFAIAVSIFINIYVWRRSRDGNLRLLFAANFIAIVWLVAELLGVFSFLGERGLAPLLMPFLILVAAFVALRRETPGHAPIAYQTVFQTIRDGVLILDCDDVIRDINPSAAKGLAKSPGEIIGTPVRAAFEAWPAAVELYDSNPVELGEIEVSLFGQTRHLLIDSAKLASKEGSLEGRIVTIRDITDRIEHQESLEALAFHDPLTRVANRRKFQEEFERAIETATGTGEPLALLYIDLNRFKEVNDTLGHTAGDELLKYVAARIASVLRKPDVLARLGGDEFGLLLHKCDENGVRLVCDRLMENVTRPFRLGDTTLIADLSIGAAFFPKDGATLTELLRRADAEMYRAKQNGGGLVLEGIKVDSSSELSM